MAKNVIITEDGHSKTISNATRIRTALDGGGTCYWIPKDDVPLQELTVTEDGVYDPEEGYYGFSQVTANGVGTVVEGTLIEKTVTKNGTYNITDESGNPYGYSKIVVNVDTSEDSGGDSGGGSTPVIGKDEDGNDTMAEADDDGNIVMTALPTEIKVIIPPTKLEYNRYEEIDYSGISVYAYISKAVHWLGTTTTAISEGSSNNVVSIGGNSVTASVSDGVLYAPDRTGQNDVQLVWDGAKWVKPSNYSAEKAVWKSDKYPTGKIPFEELMFPVKRANGAEGEKEEVEIKRTKYGDIYVGNDITIIYSHVVDYSNQLGPTIGLITCDEQDVIHLIPSQSIVDVKACIIDGVFNSGYAQLASSFNYSTKVTSYVIVAWPYGDQNSSVPCIKSFTHAVADYEDPTTHALVYAGSLQTDSILVPLPYGDARRVYTKNNKNVNYCYYLLADAVDTPYVFDVFQQNIVTSSARTITYPQPSYLIVNPSVNELGEIAWEMIYGDDVEDQEEAYVLLPITLPVQWKRPGDGKILETTFTAWMKDDGGDNNGGDD